MTTRRTFASPSFDVAALVARVSLALLFVPAGWSKIGGFAGTAGFIASKGLPLPDVAAALAIAIELGLGLALLAGIRTRWAALGLAVFTAVVTPLFHNYWAQPAPAAMMQQLMFWKNVGVFGGLVLLAGIGGGRFSVDEVTGVRAPSLTAA